MIKCIVFDFDGVLVDSNAIKRSAYFDIFSFLDGAHPSVESVLGKNRDGDRYQIIAAILQRLIEAGLLSLENNTISNLTRIYSEQYNCICEEYAATCREMPGVSLSLPELARRYVLYVNSATPEKPLLRIIRRRGWEGYFRDVCGRPQTKTENLAWILESAKVRSSETVFVGDDQGDFEAAVKVDCHFVGLVSDTSQLESEPNYSIRSLSDLQRIIDHLDHEQGNDP
jgi:phosphoglycolate phosphatase-like HAD superfamily hydrolase